MLEDIVLHDSLMYQNPPERRFILIPQFLLYISHADVGFRIDYHKYRAGPCIFLRRCVTREIERKFMELKSLTPRRGPFKARTPWRAPPSLFIPILSVGFSAYSSIAFVPSLRRSLRWPIKL